ncbi:unnamed protein product [Thlaspi arvense]|uniref:arginine--tRNA ligase n=1 Tax=Thlaspi arvense TaxID=13288 RepID=A0AAU9SS98_THLAR|nr:unnamed protein product [Thlaspi arvense]
MVPEDDLTGNLKRKVAKLFEAYMKSMVPDEPVVKPTHSPKFGDYQFNNAIKLCSKGKDPEDVVQDLMKILSNSEMVESCSVEKGFVNVSIENMLLHGIGTWAPTLAVKRAVVDFFSPNIAKEMHVGHLRSTIIGDTIARMLEYSKVEVLRRNHVGDWGTQFGMLIEYLFEKFSDPEHATELTVGELQAFYKEAQARFKSEPNFKEKAQKGVVRLQSGDPKYRMVWAKICEISRIEFTKIYQRLGVELEEKGESFYNPYIPQVIEELRSKNLVEESEGAQVIFLKVEGIVKPKPLIVVKSDGGYNYETTDLTALWYRLNEEKAEWIIYVAGSTQNEHFDLLFRAARKAGWLQDNEITSHVGFGSVQGPDGKPFRTRDSEVVRLVDLLDEAKARSKAALIDRGKNRSIKWTPEELDKTAEAVGYGAVKYADLKSNRSTNYKFNADQMLMDKGDTAVYLLYAHARIFSIIEKSGKDMDELKKTGKLVLDADERALGLHLLKFSENVEEACTNLLPSVLCKYLYNLSECYNKFQFNCQVIGSEQETSRLLLCQATAIVMRKCFHLLGITPVYKL